jgi:hypothetical protein
MVRDGTRPLSEDNSTDKRDRRPPTKKAYATPAFRFEKVRETSALSCGKVHTTEGICRMNRKTS